MTKWLACAISCVLVLGAALPTAAAARRDIEPQRWTLRSGAVVYQLASRDGRLTLEYFGPNAKSVARDAADSPTRYDLAGLAEGLSLSPDSLRIEDARKRSPAPGVEELHIRLSHERLPLSIDATYTAWGETGVITRGLRLTNRGATAMRVDACPSIAWTLPKGDYTMRYLWGGWGMERQLAAEPVGVGARRFEQTNGRSTQGYVPWLSLRNETSGVEYLAELAWSGNWSMEVERRAEVTPGAPALRDQDLDVAMGIRHDFGGALTLAPGSSFELPRAAFTASDGDLDDAANRMHRYQRQYVFPRSTTNSPLLVQFNTWYPIGEKVSVETAKRYADAAAEIGAEAFVVDSGWYSRTDWTKELGDYEVNTEKFPRGLEELSDYVHGKGMKFGLWIEIENVGPESRLFREHPDWCLPYSGQPVLGWGRHQLDYAKPEVRAWARRTIDRLVRTYRLDWIKIDYNAAIGDRFDPGGSDRRGDRLYQHVVHYYRWLDEVRAAYPNLVVENCASGGLRFDTGVMAHTHTTWISDTVNPIASLQLAYGSTLQFAPEVCNHWMVGDKDSGEVDPTRAPGWWDFMFRVPMNGQFGISSRLVEWSPAVRDRAIANVALYKRTRGVIAASDVYHLTPQPDPVRPTGWTALQYVTADAKRSVLMAYRLAGGEKARRFRLRGLTPDAVYTVSEEGKVVTRAKGAHLAATGVRVALDDEWRAAVLEIERLP